MYGWGVEHENFDALVQFFESCHSMGCSVRLFAPMAEWLDSRFGYRVEGATLFGERDTLDASVQFLVSVGGDGTFLDSVQYALNAEIPIVGINFGHLGFLASAQALAARSVVEALVQGNYAIEHRAMAKAVIPGVADGHSLFALNDITVQKSSKSMLITNVHIDGVFLCTYWSDGLIISTPTGSTAYSLSVGGPIIVPFAQTLLLSPIAPHNLSIRPLVLPDSSVIHLRSISRDPEIVLGVDAQGFRVQGVCEVTVTRALQEVRVVRLPGENFYTALREKLKWGMDVRN